MLARGADRQISLCEGVADRPTRSVDDSGVAKAGNFSLRKGVVMKSKIINSLYRLSDNVGTCGRKGSLQCDGDGLVALYNLLQFTHNDVDIQDVNDECIRRAALFFDGCGPLKIWKIRRVLKRFGVNTKYKGRLRSLSQLEKPYKFLIVYWKKNDGYRIKFCAGRLVKNHQGEIMIETANPYRHYISIAQFIYFEKTFMPLLFVVK